MNKTYLVDKLKFFLTTKDDFSVEQAQELVSPEKDIHSVKNFVEIIKKLRSRPIKLRTSVSKNSISIFSRNVYGDIKLIFNNLGYIDKLFIIPKTPNVHNIEMFKKALLLLNCSFNILVYKNGKEYAIKNKNDKNFAIASLIKLVVAAAIYDEIEKENKISLNYKVKILPGDLSYLSPGLSKQNIGFYYSIRELLTFMLIASDNTAMDVLIRIIGESQLCCFIENLSKEAKQKGVHSKIKPTKVIYGKAWCSGTDSEKIWRYRSFRNVMWTSGLDYFIPLELMKQAVDKIVKSKWTPWDELNNRSKIIYKSGHAPGILSALWSTRTAGKKQLLSAFVLNRSYTFTMLEELYAYDCARKYLLQLGLFV